MSPRKEHSLTVDPKAANCERTTSPCEDLPGNSNSPGPASKKAMKTLRNKASFMRLISFNKSTDTTSPKSLRSQSPDCSLVLPNSPRPRDDSSPIDHPSRHVRQGAINTSPITDCTDETDHSGDTVTPRTFRLQRKRTRDCLRGLARATTPVPATSSSSNIANMVPNKNKRPTQLQLQTDVPLRSSSKYQVCLPQTESKDAAAPQTEGAFIITPVSNTPGLSWTPPSSAVSSVILTPSSPVSNANMGTSHFNNAGASNHDSGTTLVDSQTGSSHIDSFQSFFSATTTSTELSNTSPIEATLPDEEYQKQYQEEMRRRDDRHLAFREQQRYDIRHRTGTDLNYNRPSTPLNLTHPQHNRLWHSTNLRCASCHKSCSLCGQACCWYSAVISACASLSKDLPAEKQEAAFIKAKIERAYPTGEDLSTFVQCTNEGCQKVVCPRCAGRCPVFPCLDVLCVKCKPKPWEACDWHEEI